MTMLVVPALLMGCTSEGGEQTAEAEQRIFVGETSDDDGRVLVGMLVQGDRGRLFGCGESLADPVSPWIPISNIDGQFDSGSDYNSGGWKTIGTLSGDRITGNVTKTSASADGSELEYVDLSFELVEVDPDDPAGPGIYQDQSGCLAGAVVPNVPEGERKEAMLGSSCVDGLADFPEATRAQVTPLRPVGDGWEVELADGPVVVLERLVLAR